MSKNSKSSLSTLTMKPSDAAVAIKHMITVNMRNAELGKDRRGLFLWGAPGIAKSSIIRQICRELNYKLIDVRLTQMEPTDLRGIPVPIKNDAGQVVVNWALPEMLPKRDPGKKTGTIPKDLVDRAHENDLLYDGAVILLDELPNAAPVVQAGSYQLVLDGALGEYVAPSNVVIMAAGNRETDKGATFKMPTPLMNRFTHIELQADFNDWQTHAILNNFDKDVIGYLTAFKSDLFNFEPASASRGFATPRSWEMVSDIIRDSKGLPETVKTALISGSVGDAVAVKFIAHQKLATSLPPSSDILDGKAVKLPNKDMALMYALATELCYELRERFEASKKDKTNTALKDKYDESFDNFLGFAMDEFRPEMVVMAVRTAVHTMRLHLNSAKLKNFIRFAENYQELILV